MVDILARAATVDVLPAGDATRYFKPTKGDDTTYD